jgi:hypothetical protein
MRAVPGSKHVSCLACNMDFVIIGPVQIQDQPSNPQDLDPELTYFLRTDEDEVYGPFSMKELEVQSEDLRIAPEYQVSTDNIEWIDACEIDNLAMNWLVPLPDGSDFGPMHVNMLKELLNEDQIGPSTIATHKSTGEKIPVADFD